MSVAVLMQARIDPRCLSAVLEALKDRIEPAAQHASGRLRERIFQRLGSNGDLLSLSQWETAEAFVAASKTLSAEVVRDALTAPTQTHYLTRLLTFERPLQRSEVTAGALIVPTHGDSPAVRERVVHDRAEFRDAPGLVSHEVYVTTDPPITYLSIHSWRLTSDLQRFRSETGALNERRLAEVGATLDRFTGALVAEYPKLTARG